MPSWKVVAEAENFTQNMSGLTRNWLTATAQSDYTGTAYLHALPDIDALYQTGEITASPRIEYAVDFTTPNTYTVWIRGFASNAAGDSVYVSLDEQLLDITGFAPSQWEWANTTTGGMTATLAITTTGVHTLSLAMREDGLRIDRLLLTTDTTYIPTGFGPAESPRVLASSPLVTPLTRTIVYTYDKLYRLTDADYTTGENYQYSYDPVGNRLQQIINGDTTSYLYDAANRLASVDGQAYTFDNNGNLLTTGALTNTWDAANRLVSTQRATTTLQPLYNGVGDRVAQTVGTTTTNFALDVAGGLPEVIYTSGGNAYLHLPGVIMAESNIGEVRYLLSDGLGSVRQAVDETGVVIAYHEFDPYGNPVDNDGGEPYGFTGEWWDEVGLLHLRTRWYQPETGTFLSRDAVESEPAYLYARGDPVNFTDPSGLCVPDDPICWAIYERILQLCPECADLGLYDKDTVSLERILDDVMNGWRPDLPKSKPATWGLSPFELIPSNGRNGYVEGLVASISGFGCIWKVYGVEVVYDFASRQRQIFTYSDAPWAQRGYSPVPGLSFSLFSINEVGYAGLLSGFSGRGVEEDYSGYFVGTSLGLNPTKTGDTWPKEMGGAIGWGQFTSAGTNDNPWAAINGKGTVSGDVVYFGANIGVSKTAMGKAGTLKLPIDASLMGTFYQPLEGRDADEYVARELQMLKDLRSGSLTPVSSISNVHPLGILRDQGVKVGASIFANNGWITANEYREVTR